MSEYNKILNRDSSVSNLDSKDYPYGLDSISLPNQENQGRNQDNQGRKSSNQANQDKIKVQTFKQTELGLIPEDWRISTLGEFIKLKNGYSFKSEFFSKKGPIVITPGNFNLEGGLKFNDKNTIHYSGEVTNNMLFNKGDLLIVMTDLTPSCDLLGKPGIVHLDKQILHNQRIGKIIITSASLDKEFLYWFFISDTFSNWMKSTATGSTVRHTSVGSINKTQIPVPPLPEQKAIAQVLSDTDTLIQTLEQKLVKKRAIKQGAMQQLLTPNPDSNAGDWEVKKLGEVLQFGNGKDYKHLKSGHIPVYGTGGIMTFVNDYIFDGESVGIGRKGTIDKPIFLKGKFWTVDTLFFTHSFKESNPKYIYYQFMLIRWKDYNEASGVPSLNKKTLEEIEVRIPPLEEQTRIATILSDMDAEIAQLEQKLDKYKLLKQGLMQELLTGRIRLV